MKDWLKTIQFWFKVIEYKRSLRTNPARRKRWESCKRYGMTDAETISMIEKNMHSEAEQNITGNVVQTGSPSDVLAGVVEQLVKK